MEAKRKSYYDDSWALLAAAIGISLHLFAMSAAAQCPPSDRRQKYAIELLAYVV
ncbi:MAG: hypothetical protein K6G00_05840 [Treponema sp.]|nr:hypothetical protein [Treponema sp.]